MSDDHFGTREEMIDRYRELQAQLAAVTRERDQWEKHAGQYMDERDQAERRGMERAAEIASATVCATHLPTGVCIYGDKAADAILSEAGKLP